MTSKVFDPLNDEKSSLSLVQLCASDLMIANAAKVSFGQSSDELGEAEIGLINFLMRERHGSPFEHNMFTFHVRCPIFVAREWFRHRIGSFNEYSGRYKEMKPDFYIPSVKDVRTQVGKPGSYRFESMAEEVAELVREQVAEAARTSWSFYQWQLDQGVAKELARDVLSVNIYTEFYWTVNARSLMNFLSLRNHVAALREIRYFAECVEVLFATAMPITHAAFEKTRLAP